MTGKAFIDGRASMRFVFVSMLQRIAMMPAGPKGHLTNEKAAQMAHLEWTALPWIEDDKEFKARLEVAKQATDPDAVAYMRYSATIFGLKKVKMLDVAVTPYDSDDVPELPGAEGLMG